MPSIDRNFCCSMDIRGFLWLPSIPSIVPDAIQMKFIAMVIVSHNTSAFGAGHVNVFSN
jgi:hypothetical protein